MMIGNPDATTCFEHHWNSPRERFRNPNLDFIAVTDPCFSGNLRVELQSSREDEIRSLRNDAQSWLPDQEFFKTPTNWNISRDDDLPRAAASISGSPLPARAQQLAHGWLVQLQVVPTVLR
jgi:hypothetical protein